MLSRVDGLADYYGSLDGQIVSRCFVESGWLFCGAGVFSLLLYLVRTCVADVKARVLLRHAAIS